jgi:hypothetical protein
MRDRFVKNLREIDHETLRKTRKSLLTDQERSVLIVFCCFEGEEPSNQPATDSRVVDTDHRP